MTRKKTTLREAYEHAGQVQRDADARLCVDRERSLRMCCGMIGRKVTRTEALALSTEIRRAAEAEREQSLLECVGLSADEEEIDRLKAEIERLKKELERGRQ